MNQSLLNSGWVNRSTGIPESHCVFRCGTSWLALPAMTVREVLQRPAIVGVPGTPGMFAGLCHVRSEFIPVIRLDPLLPKRRRSTDDILLIVEDKGGCWAVLVDQVSALRNLEISDAPETEDEEWSSAVIGWATEGSNVIQVLDPQRLSQLSRRELTLHRERAGADARSMEKTV